MIDEARWRRVRWRCRRGMRELDVLLTRHVDALMGTPAEAARELPLIERFLELQDPELQRYLLAGEDPLDSQLAALAARVRRAPRFR